MARYTLDISVPLSVAASGFHWYPRLEASRVHGTSDDCRTKLSVCAFHVDEEREEDRLSLAQSSRSFCSVGVHLQFLTDTQSRDEEGLERWVDVAFARFCSSHVEREVELI